MIISFSGVDGSGKSTCTKLTGEFIESLGYRVIIHHIFKFSLYYQLGRILSFFSIKKAKKLVEDQYCEEKRKTLVNRLLFMIRVMCFFIDIFSFKLIFLNFSKKNGTWYVFDRFFIDQVVQLFYLNAIDSRYFSFLLKYSFMSDIPFLLKLDPREAMRRKPEFPTEYFERKSNIYNSLAADDKVITMENQDQEETQRRIRETIRRFLENEKS